jgi:hypothetical protein
MRRIAFHYQDPLDLIWIETARQLEMRVERSSEVYAHWDGRGTLFLGTAETLDPDDSVAQLILHEICHALVEGPEQFQVADWGLVYDEAEHRVHEHACLRLQAALTDAHGLRELLASTTDYRPYFDRLPVEPLSAHADCPDENESAAIQLARMGWERATTGAWATPLANALRRTRMIHEAVDGMAGPDSVWRSTRVQNCV